MPLNVRRPLHFIPYPKRHVRTDVHVGINIGPVQDLTRSSAVHAATMSNCASV
jgi:hypothetical protein